MCNKCKPRRPYMVKTHGGVDSLLLTFEVYHTQTGVSMGHYHDMDSAVRACMRHESIDNRRKMQGAMQ
jgi:hypothetical protein